jgi:hypothetical protein
MERSAELCRSGCSCKTFSQRPNKLPQQTTPIAASIFRCSIFVDMPGHFFGSRHQVFALVRLTNSIMCGTREFLGLQFKTPQKLPHTVELQAMRPAILWLFALRSLDRIH